MPQNYISISGISEMEQLDGIARICQDESLALPLAIGYQVSSKSINQGTQNSRQPKVSELQALDEETRSHGFRTAIHYFTKDNATIVDDLEQLADMGLPPAGMLLQLNTLPAEHETLRQVKEMGFQVIFKVAVSDKQGPNSGYAVWKGDSVEDMSGGSVDNLVRQVRERNNLVDYAMFDPSHGTNLSLDLDETSLPVRFGKAIASHPDLDHIGLVYAGGIGPDNVARVAGSLTTYFPGRVSIDSESRVRTEDRLDLDKIRRYLKAYYEILDSN